MSDATIPGTKTCTKCGQPKIGGSNKYRCKACCAAASRASSFRTGRAKRMPVPRERLPDGQRRCSGCKAIGPATTEFFGAYCRGKGGISRYCRKCTRENAATQRLRQPKKPPRPTLADRLWAKVDKCGPIPERRPELGPCWDWLAYKNPNGYGQVRVGGRDGRSVLAHRVAYCMANNLEISAIDGIEICHHCDRGCCVRPEHLFAGSHKDNMADMVSKGRQQRGERNAGTRLTEDDVVAIRGARASGETITSIAARYRMSRAGIREIVRRRNWRHVA